MTASHYVWKALDALAGSEATSQEDEYDRTQKCVTLMEHVVADADLGELVERYGATQAVPTQRALSFMLSLAASQSPAPRMRQWVFQVAVRFQGGDTTTLTNLLTAAHRLAIAEVLVEPDAAPSPALFDLAMRGLQGATMTQSAALGLIGRLHEDGHLGRLTRAERATMVAQIDQLRAGSDLTIQLDLESLELPETA